jgi:hypothetical protein
MISDIDALVKRLEPIEKEYDDIDECNKVAKKGTKDIKFYLDLSHAENYYHIANGGVPEAGNSDYEPDGPMPDPPEDILNPKPSK